MSNKLYSLEERMDAQLRAFAADDEEQPGVGRRVAAGVAGAAAGAGAAYGINRYRKAQVPRLPGDIPRLSVEGAAPAANAAVAGGKKAIKKGITGVAGLLSKGKKGGLLRKAGASILGATRGFDTATADRIIELATRISELEDGLHDFDEDEHHFGGDTRQRDPAGIQAVGQYANGWLGGREALMARDKFAGAGHVYRKRDAAKDGVKGNLGGAALAGGTLAGGVLGSRALMKATAGGKVGKGMLRKGAVSVSKKLRAAGRSPAVAVGSLLAAGVGSQLAGARIQRNSADTRLTKRRAED